MKIEKKAKELWCPMARSEGSNMVDSGKYGVVLSYCIASRCMMWRWDHNKLVTGDYREGFCGLGGKPQ